jgi:hypothetical protein
LSGRQWAPVDDITIVNIFPLPSAPGSWLDDMGLFALQDQGANGNELDFLDVITIVNIMLYPLLLNRSFLVFFLNIWYMIQLFI